MKSSEQFHILRRCSIIIGVIVIMMVGSVPVLPDITYNRNLIIGLNVLRVTICSLAFFRYLTFYVSKGTRFSLLLCLAFLFLGVSYFIIIGQAFSSISVQSPNDVTLVDSIIRVFGSGLLFVAFVVG